MIVLRTVATECALFALFAGGVWFSAKLGRRWRPTELTVLYGFGLLFEMLTEHFWQYHNIILTVPIRCSDDISVMFPAAWTGLVAMSTATALWLWNRLGMKAAWARHLVLMGVWFVFGNVLETSFHDAGMIEYVRDESTAINFLLGKLPYLPPGMVMIGYPVVFPLVSWFMIRLAKCRQ